MPDSLADILDRAADIHLWDGTTWDVFQCEYTCNAVAMAVSGKSCEDGFPQSHEYARIFDIPYSKAFDEIPYGPERQSVRYAFLKLAAQFCREEGI